MTWQPIEAAPKDGTLVDLWCVGCSDIYEAKPIRLTDCSWHNADDIFNFTGWVRICDDGHWDAVEMDAACELGLPAWTPTHWTLPPAAPGSQPTEQPPQEKRLSRNQPCGCIVCQCEDDDQCQGCGAKSCGNHPVGEIPNPVYEQPPQADTPATKQICVVDCGKEAPECKCRAWLDTKAELLPPQADVQGPAQKILNMRESIMSDIQSAHSNRGDGASDWMREDDRGFRAELREAFDQLDRALAGEE